MRIAVTGATGFIGGEIVSYLQSQRHEVIAIKRNPIANSTDRYYDITQPDIVPDLAGIEAVVHTAFVKYDIRTQPNASALNVASALALEKACKGVGAQYIFLSTMSAHPAAESQYGKHKYEIEQKLDTTYTIILRLGLVIGKGGLFATIRQSIEKGKIVPMVDGGKQPIQTVAVTEVCSAIVTALTKNQTEIYTLATTQVYALHELYRSIARATGRSPIFVNLPYSIVNAGLSAIEILRVPLNISKENLLGLKHLIAFDTKSDLEKLGVTLMDMDTAIAKAMQL